MTKTPAKLPQGIMKQIGKHLKWVDEPFDSSTLGKLKADVYYVTGKKGTRAKYAYTTDAKGRLSSAHAHPLQLGKTKRASHSRNPAGKQPGDHAGHLLGDVFGGSSKLDNIVAQTSDVNLSKFRKLERSWQAGLNATPPQAINVDIAVKYGSDGRPTSFVVNQTIDGVPQPPVRLPNK